MLSQTQLLGAALRVFSLRTDRHRLGSLPPKDAASRLGIPADKLPSAEPALTALPGTAHCGAAWGSEASQPCSPLSPSPQDWVMHCCGSPRCVMPINIPKREQREKPPRPSSSSHPLPRSRNVLMQKSRSAARPRWAMLAEGME